MNVEASKRLFLMPSGNDAECEERGHDWLPWDTEPPTVACSHCGEVEHNPDDEVCPCGHQRRRHWSGTGPSGFRCQDCGCEAFKR